MLLLCIQVREEFHAITSATSSLPVEWIRYKLAVFQVAKEEADLKALVEEVENDLDEGIGHIFSGKIVYSMYSNLFTVRSQFSVSQYIITCNYIIMHASLQEPFNSCITSSSRHPSWEGHSVTDCRQSVCCCCPSPFIGCIRVCTAFDGISLKWLLMECYVLSTNC